MEHIITHIRQALSGDSHAISHKSNQSGSSHHLMQEVTKLIQQLVDDYLRTGDESRLVEQKKLLLGDKQSLLDAVVALRSLTQKDIELRRKYPQTLPDQPSSKPITTEDLDIIQQFIARQPAPPK